MPGMLTKSDPAQDPPQWPGPPTILHETRRTPRPRPCAVHVQRPQPFLVSTILAFVQGYSGYPADAQPIAYGWRLVSVYSFICLGQTRSISLVHDLCSGALVVGLRIYILYPRVGLAFPASLAAVSSCFLFIPSQRLRALGLGTKQGKWSAETDKNVSLMSSITADTQDVKLSAYGDILSTKVKREEELQKGSSMMK